MGKKNKETDSLKSTPTLIDKPPFFKSWKQIYGFVLAVFLIIVILLYFFTIIFS